MSSVRVSDPRMRVNIGDVRLFFDVEGAKLRPDGADDARGADRHPPARRSRLRPFELQARLLAAGRDRAGRLSRPSRERPQRSRRSQEMESAAMGRRRARVLRRAGNRAPDRAGQLVRRDGRDVVRDAPSGSSGQAGIEQHGRREPARSIARNVREAGRGGSARSGATVFRQSRRGNSRRFSEKMPAVVQPGSVPGPSSRSAR